MLFDIRMILLSWLVSMRCMSVTVHFLLVAVYNCYCSVSKFSVDRSEAALGSYIERFILLSRVEFFLRNTLTGLSFLVFDPGLVNTSPLFPCAL